MDFIAFGEKEFGKIGTVLARDAGDERAFHGWVSSGRELGKLRFDKSGDHGVEGHSVFPTEQAFRLGGIATGCEGFARHNEIAVIFYVIVPVEVDDLECARNQFFDAVQHAGGQDKVVHGIALQHPPHAVDLIGRPAPVAPPRQASENEFALETTFDPGGGPGNLHGYEAATAPGGFMIVKDDGAGGELIRDAVDPGHVL